ncbi:aminotransferase class V-fold PLP-dependent enzyme [Candidatus Bathyarchaeota archaeon]|nr:aminotransferase class V-fold PLP-dependent enzyme [Candidatus Bathyarchaeota archaeon]
MSINREEEFPMLKHWVFLDAANAMIPARYWLNAIRECLNIYEFAPYGQADHPFLTVVFKECIQRAAKLIHAKECEITNIYRVMTAANLIINDLIEWRKGDNVVFSDLDYPSIPFILMNLQKKKGVELRRIRNMNGEIPMDALEKNIDDRTKLVCVNRTTPWCGFTYDVKEVCRVAHEHGSLVLDDSIQSIGAIDVDVHKDDVDFLLTGSYKWQCGPEGAGIFYIKEELIDDFDPDFRNYIWSEVPGGIPFSRLDHDNLTSWNYPLVKNANRFDMGVCVTPILFGWNATLKFYERVGIEKVERNVRRMGDYCFSNSLSGPEGAGIFYIKEELIDDFDPDFRNYIWSEVPGGIPFSRLDHDNLTSWNYPLVKNANRFDMGVCVTPILFGWNATLKFYERVGIEKVERNVRRMGDYCIDRLHESGCRVLTPVDPKKRHGLIVYTNGSYEIDSAVYKKLDASWTYMKPIKVSFRGVGGIIGIRASCHFFNTKEDIDALVESQEKARRNLT